MEFIKTVQRAEENVKLRTVDQQQEELSDKYLQPNLDEIFAFFCELRAAIDFLVKLEANPNNELPPEYTEFKTIRKYPIDFCVDITKRCLQMVNEITESSTVPKRYEKFSNALNALRNFLREGGDFRSVGVIFKKKFIHHGIQMGSFWLNIANNAIAGEEEPVTLMPLDQAPIKDFESLEEYCATYENHHQGVKIYPNPAGGLMPFYPVVSVNSIEVPQVELLELIVSIRILLSRGSMTQEFLESSAFGTRVISDEARTKIFEAIKKRGKLSDGTARSLGRSSINIFDVTPSGNNLKRTNKFVGREMDFAIAKEIDAFVRTVNTRLRATYKPR